MLLCSRFQIHFSVLRIPKVYIEVQTFSCTLGCTFLKSHLKFKICMAQICKCQEECTHQNASSHFWAIKLLFYSGQKMLGRCICYLILYILKFYYHLLYKPWFLLEVDDCSPKTFLSMPYSFDEETNEKYQPNKLNPYIVCLIWGLHTLVPLLSVFNLMANKSSMHYSWTPAPSLLHKIHKPDPSLPQRLEVFIWVETSINL